eukprot:1287497-Rhodomonas_salina.1
MPSPSAGLAPPALTCMARRRWQVLVAPLLPPAHHRRDSLAHHDQHQSAQVRRRQGCRWQEGLSPSPRLRPLSSAASPRA